MGNWVDNMGLREFIDTYQSWVKTHSEIKVPQNQNKKEGGMMKLREDRDIDMIENVNIALLDRIIQAFNDLGDNEFIDVLWGVRCNFSLLQNETGEFKLCDANCIMGMVDNIRCQWLEKGQRCKDVYCEHFEKRND